MLSVSPVMAACKGYFDYSGGCSMKALASTLGKTRQILWNLLLMGFGSSMCAISVNAIILPQEFIGAGFTGVALVLHYLFPSWQVATVYLLLNIPVFIMGWAYVSRRFFLYSLVGMLMFTAALNWIHISLPLEDKILSALLAGIIMGVGSGIILRSWGSAGGTDILSVILLKRFSVRLGSTVLAFNAVVLLAGALLFSLEGALYTLVYLYVNAGMVNLVVTGLSQRKAIYIVSPQSPVIARGIMEQIQRGVTIIHGRGGFSGKEENILFTVITFRELPRLKRLVHEIDPNAFMVVSDTLEVMGQRIGNQPHW